LNNYEERLVSLFQCNSDKPYLIYDSENRFGQGSLFDLLQKKGFTIIVYESPIQIRYYYEKEIRNNLEQGTELNIIIVIPENQIVNARIPMDIMQNIENIEIRIAKIYPRIPSVLGSKIPSKILDCLDETFSQLTCAINDKKAKSLILQELGYDPSSRINPENVLISLSSFFESEWVGESFLLNIFIQSIPNSFISVFYNGQQFPHNRSEFYEWLNRKWQDFVFYISKMNEIPPVFDFEQASMKNLILGLITAKKISVIKLDSMEGIPDWVKIGIIQDVDANFKREYEELIELYENSAKNGLNINDWEHIVEKIATLEILLAQSDLEGKLTTSLLNLFDNIDDLFSNWFKQNYLALHKKSSALKPNFVGQILPFLSRKNQSCSSCKIAILVIDCMSNLAWNIIRMNLDLPSENFLSMSYVLTEIPTITRVCRTSLLGGINTWDQNPSLLSKNYNEEDLWTSFWENKGFNEANRYCRLDLQSLQWSTIISDFLETPYLSLIIDDIDKMVHSSMSYNDLFSRIKQFVTLKLQSLINILLDKGYRIYLTTDHGFRRCLHKINFTTLLSKQSKLFLQSKGGRFTISERNEKETEFFHNLTYQQLGIPENKWIYLAKASYTFTKTAVGFDHGGLSISEVVIPFIQIGANSGDDEK